MDPAHGQHPSSQGGGAPPFRVDVRTLPHATLIRVAGELDLGTAGTLAQALARRTGRVVLDLRGVSFIDASGLRPLLEAAARSRRDGLDLELATGPAVDRFLALLHLQDEFTYARPRDRIDAE